MQWYHLLITDEFIDYFCGDNHVYYQLMQENNEYKPEPLFSKFIETVLGIAYAFNRFELKEYELLSMKKSAPHIYEAYERCNEVMPPVIRLSDIWQSIRVQEDESRYQKDVRELSAEQIAVLIMYPFWHRMGSRFEIDFLESGSLKKYLLALKEKAQ